MPFAGCAFVLSAIALSALPLAQGTPPATSNPPSNTQSIRVRGCLNGRTISPVLAPDPLLTPYIDGQYRLNGSKAMMATLKEHDGHEDEILGTMQISTPTKTKAITEKKVGRGRVYVGAGRDTSPGEAPGAEDLTIEVGSLTHLKPVCG